METLLLARVVSLNALPLAWLLSIDSDFLITPITATLFFNYFILCVYMFACIYVFAPFCAFCP